MYLINTYSHKNRLATSPPQPPATSQLELSVRKLALEQSRAAASASAGTSEASTDDDEDAPSSSADSSDESSEEDK